MAVTEGYVDVALAVYREVVRQEILHAGFLRLRLADLLVQFVEACFEGFVPGSQVIVLFLVGLLIEGDAGVFVDV